MWTRTSTTPSATAGCRLLWLSLFYTCLVLGVVDDWPPAASRTTPAVGPVSAEGRAPTSTLSLAEKRKSQRLSQGVGWQKTPAYTLDTAVSVLASSGSWLIPDRKLVLGPSPGDLSLLVVGVGVVGVDGHCRLRFPGLRLLWGRLPPEGRAPTSTLSLAKFVQVSKVVPGCKPAQKRRLTPSTQLAPSWLPPALG